MHNDLQCLEGTNSLYIEKTTEGYAVSPCCLYKNTNRSVSVPIQNLIYNPYINKIRETLKDDWSKNPGCIDCVRNEQIGENSLRMYSLMNGYDGVVRKWDIRPGNTCNLKCAMCNLSSSSKWIEDIDILKKYKVVAQNSDYDVNHGRENLDFDWIYSQCVDTAEFIYIAGGEPFYMKNVYNFLNKLSKHEWNCKNTRIQMVTNGVSNTPKFLDMLSRFKKIEFNISIDGWGDVNEIIRFPTDHNEFIRNADELVQLNPYELKFTATVQCMNLPNIDELVSNIKDRWNASYNLFLINGPEHLRIDSLKPQVIERVLETTKLPILKQFCSEYEYDESLNKTMQNYLLDLDAKRKTNSKEVLGWCFE